MNDNTIKLNGNLSQISRQLNYYGIILEENETKLLIDTILSNKDYLQTNEFAASEVHFPHFPANCFGLMTLNYSYHISIKKLSLCAFVLLFDNRLTKGLADKVLSALGVSLKAVNQINEYNGEKCVVKETVLFHNNLGNVNILERFKGNCCNNDINCSYREDDKCKCTKENIKDRYEKLTEKNVFEKINSSYKLNW